MVGKSLHTFEIIRNFVSKFFNKEFLIFLFFLILSGFFWLINALDDYYEQDFSVELKLAGIPKNVVITGEVDSVVKVTLRDKGYVIANYITQGNLRPLYFDFDANSHSGSTGEIQVSEIQRLLAQQLSSSTKIVSVKANSLVYSYNYGRCKKVPVRLEGMVLPTKGYYLPHVQFVPDSVTVYASKKLLDSIKYVSTQRIELTNVSEPIVQKVGLQKMKNAKALPLKVKLKLYPDILTEETVDVPIETINVPADKVMRVFPGTIKVKFAVGAERVKSLPKIDGSNELKHDGFKVVVDYKEIENHKTEKCNVYVKAMPKGIRNARPVVSMVDYLIEQR